MNAPKYNSEDLTDHDAIGVVIKDASGRILMQEHVKYGFWTIPIGKAKKGQLPVDCAKEEVFEECNLKIDNLAELVRKDYVYERGDKNVGVHLFLYEAKSVSGRLENKEPHKHKVQLYLSLSEIKAKRYLSDATVLYLATLGFSRNALI